MTGQLHKIYRLKPHEIAPIVPGHGMCLATDRITVDGVKVGYMYREYPIEHPDSGWRFFSGDEDAAFMADDQRHGVYELNTIVNYDPDILPYIEAPIGSRFERVDGGKFRRLHKYEE